MNKLIESMWDDVSPEMKAHVHELVGAVIDAMAYVEHGGSDFDQTELFDQLRTVVEAHRPQP